MKLEVGMYVRTNNNGIAKIKGINNNFLLLDKIPQSVFIQNVIRASHNIIGLIEVGDILEINNEKYEVIYDKSYDKLGILIPSREELSIRHSALEYVFKKYKVSIVTKEQFEVMQYKVGE